MSSVDHTAELARLVVLAGQRLHRSALIAGSAGNLSARLDESSILITPRGAHKGHLEASELVVLPLDASPEDVARASTEFPFHRACYLARADVGAVVHTHAPAVVAAGVRELDIAAVLPEVDLATGLFATVPALESGSEALGEAVGRAVARGAGVVLLRQHGAVAVGRDVEEAVNRMELAELAAYTVLLAEHGRGAVNPERVGRLGERRLAEGEDTDG